MDAIIGIIVLVAAGGAAWYGFKKVKGAPGRNRTPEQLKMIAASKVADRRFKDAKKALKDREKTWQNAQKTAGRLVSQLERLGSNKVGSLTGSAGKSLTLSETTLLTPQGTIDLTKTRAVATCDTAGNLAVSKRVTLTRLVGLGIVGGFLFKKTQKHDTRELYLLVESDSFDTMLAIDPDKGAEAREFAMKINNQSKVAGSILERRHRELPKARKALATSELEPAQVSALRKTAAAEETGAQAAKGARDIALGKQPKRHELVG